MFKISVFITALTYVAAQDFGQVFNYSNVHVSFIDENEAKSYQESKKFIFVLFTTTR